MKSHLFIAAIFLSLVFACSRINAQGTWVQKASLPALGRQGATGFVINGKGYITGGWDFSVFYQDLWQYDAANDSWTQLVTFPGTPRQVPSSFAIGGKGYVGLGYDGNNYLNDWWEYDTLTNSWTQKGNVPGGARSSAVSFAINGNGYIATGGSVIPTYRQDVWEYNPSLDSWSQKNNFGGTARRYATSFVVGNVAYVGTGQGSTGYVPTFYKYNLSSDTWTQVADAPFARVNCSSFSIGSKGYTCTGFDGFNNLSSGFEYDTLTDSWTAIANYGPGVRFAAVGLSIGNFGYVGLGRTNLFINDWWQFAPLITSTDEIEKTNSAIIFPNPYTVHTTLHTEIDLINASLIIYNLNGKKINEIKNISGRSISISHYNLPFGVYLLRLVQNDKTIAIEKLLITD